MHSGRPKRLKMKILIFDNYDSFTYNLYQLVKKQTAGTVDVYRNDCIALEKIKDYDKIILSPGPGLPSESGILPDVIEEYAASRSILGVCLGHQAIGEHFGAKLKNLENVFHGIATKIILKKFTPKKNNLFDGLDSGIEVGRYHSWIVSADNFPDELEITAVDESGTIMGLQHKVYDVQGVQFHPESIMTPTGYLMIKNFLNA